MAKTCEKYGTFFTKDNKAISAGRWGSDAQLCIETVGDSGFRVSDSALSKNGVAAYPSFYEGMWPRPENVTKNSKFPVRIQDMPGRLESKFSYKMVPGNLNCAFDIWFSEQRNTNYKLELMIWLGHTDINPAGKKVAKSGDLNDVDVWEGVVGGVKVVSYVLASKYEADVSINLSSFIADAVKRGYIQNDDYLTSVQLGFELWSRGAGSQITNYSVEYSNSPLPTNPDPTPTRPGDSMGAEYTADLNAGIPGKSFNNTNWNNEHGLGWPPPIRTDSSGAKYVEFKLPNSGKRIEIEPNHRTFGGSGEAFFHYEFMLEDSFPLARNDWQVIWQLHGNDTTSPRFALQARNGQLRIGDNKVIASLEKNRRYSVDVRADFSGGNMQVWLDGKDLGTNYVGRSNPNYYLKTGFYTEPSGNPGGTIRGYIWRLGKSLADVQNTGTTPKPQDGTVATPDLDTKLGIARTAICGANTGYPDTLFDSILASVMSARDALIKRGITPPELIGGAQGPYWPVTVASDDVAMQLGSRFAALGKYASLRELADYLEVLTQGLAK